MKKFMAAFVAVILLSVAIYFLAIPGNPLSTKAGEMLDKDIIYLNDGGLIKGCFRESVGGDILIESDSGIFTLPRSKCGMIRENALLKYIRELI